MIQASSLNKKNSGSQMKQSVIAEDVANGEMFF